MGAVWWATEVVAHWAAGSLVSPRLLVDLACGDVAIAALTGLALAPVVGRDAASVALGIAASFGLLRVYSPPGFLAEAVFVLTAGIAALLGRRFLARDAATAWPLLSLGVFGSAAFSCFDLIVNESHRGLSGPRLPIAVAGLPMMPLLLDRILARAVPGPGRRFGLQLGLAAFAVALLHRPLDTAPLITSSDAGPAAPARGPDIILVVFDTARADHLSTYGYGRETSPRLTEFGADALVFDQARSTAGWTLPGHASMFTGVLPSRHGARAAGGWLPGQSVDGRRNVAFPLAADQTTLAELLRAAGYRTGAFVANFSYLYRTFGFAQGFDHYDDAPWQLLRFRSPFMHAIERRWPTAFARPYRSGHDINAAAWQWIDQGPADRPAFLFLNYMDAHPPYAAPEPFTEWVRPLAVPPKLARRDLYAHEPRALSPTEQDFIVANYDGQLRAADAAFGALIDDLKRRGRYENALIILTSDHGTLLGEHGHLGHVGRMLYEPLLHIPLIVKLPGGRAPARSHRHPGTKS
jgi:Sulfatase